jgi:hypothetical protein
MPMGFGDVDIAAEQLDAEGMLTIERTYTFVEEVQ